MRFSATDMKTSLYITDIRNISLDRVSQLSPDRAKRVEKCRRIDDKKRCIAGGLFINKFLGDAEISVNEYGKPFCKNGAFFNISHSGNYVLFAVSSKDVGCDIEEIRQLKALRLGQIVFCDNEMNFLKSSFDVLTTFFKMWTRKEALLKCMGDGFHRGAKSVDVRGRLFCENGKNYYMKQYSFSDYEVSLCSLENDFPNTIEFLTL